MIKLIYILFIMSVIEATGTPTTDIVVVSMNTRSQLCGRVILSNISNEFTGISATIQTTYHFRVSATNWTATWSDYSGIYHGLNSNGTIRTVTNLWSP